MINEISVDKIVFGVKLGCTDGILRQKVRIQQPTFFIVYHTSGHKEKERLYAKWNANIMSRVSFETADLSTNVTLTLQINTEYYYKRNEKC